MDPFRRGLNRSVCAVQHSTLHQLWETPANTRGPSWSFGGAGGDMYAVYFSTFIRYIWLEMYEYEWQFLSSKLCFPWVWEKNRDIMWYGGFHITIFHTQWNWHESWYSFLPPLQLLPLLRLQFSKLLHPRLCPKRLFFSTVRHPTFTEASTNRWGHCPQNSSLF